MGDTFHGKVLDIAGNVARSMPCEISLGTESATAVDAGIAWGRAVAASFAEGR
jgi:hypothetical protein